MPSCRLISPFRKMRFAVLGLQFSMAQIAAAGFFQSFGAMSLNLVGLRWGGSNLTPWGRGWTSISGAASGGLWITVRMERPHNPAKTHVEYGFAQSY